jgi:hypothetical protein
MTQAIGYLSSKCKVLSSNPSTAKKQRKKIKHRKIDNRLSEKTERDGKRNGHFSLSLGKMGACPWHVHKYKCLISNLWEKIKKSINPSVYILDYKISCLFVKTMIIKSEMILCKYCSLLFGVWPAIQ